MFTSHLEGFLVKSMEPININLLQTHCFLEYIKYLTMDHYYFLSDSHKHPQNIPSEMLAKYM